MTPKSLSHVKILWEPGAKLGESDCDCKIRLEAEGASMHVEDLLLSPKQEATRPLTQDELEYQAKKNAQAGSPQEAPSGSAAVPRQVDRSNPLLRRC